MTLVPGTCWQCFFPVMYRDDDGWVCSECGWRIPNSPPVKVKPRVVNYALTLKELPKYFEYLENRSTLNV